MKDLSDIFNGLKLLYYEYDKYQNKFVKDENYDNDEVYNDFIKLTYELSKNSINFFIDERSDIVVCKKDNFFQKTKQRLIDLKHHIESSKKNIYILSDKHIKYAYNLPMIKTQTIKKDIDLSRYDAIIFTSKNGVRHLSEITKKWKNIPSYAISTQTAKEIKKYNGNLAFVGKDKHGDEFALELIGMLAKYKKIAYIGAKKIVSNINNILEKNKIDCEHIAVYETVCVEYDEKIDLPDESFVIFSSPSTVKCFFNNVNWKDSFKAISIGNTTKQYFPDGVDPIVSDNTTLQSCVQKAINF